MRPRGRLVLPHQPLKGAAQPRLPLGPLLTQEAQRLVSQRAQRTRRSHKHRLGPDLHEDVIPHLGPETRLDQRLAELAGHPVSVAILRTVESADVQHLHPRQELRGRRPLVHEVAAHDPRDHILLAVLLRHQLRHLHRVVQGHDRHLLAVGGLDSGDVREGVVARQGLRRIDNDVQPTHRLRKFFEVFCRGDVRDHRGLLIVIDECQALGAQRFESFVAGDEANLLTRLGHAAAIVCAQRTGTQKTNLQSHASSRLAKTVASPTIRGGVTGGAAGSPAPSGAPSLVEGPTPPALPPMSSEAVNPAEGRTPRPRHVPPRSRPLAPAQAGLAF